LKNHAEVNIRELKANATAIIRRVESGERVTVTKRGRTVAHIVPSSDVSSQELRHPVDSAYQALRRQVEARVPDLRRATPADTVREFDRLSRKIARALPYTTWQEMERVVKGDRFGLSRQ
jgi:prevent-host-death family protein